MYMHSRAIRRACGRRVVWRSKTGFYTDPQNGVSKAKVHDVFNTLESVTVMMSMRCKNFGRHEIERGGRVRHRG